MSFLSVKWPLQTRDRPRDLVICLVLRVSTFRKEHLILRWLCTVGNDMFRHRLTIFSGLFMSLTYSYSASSQFNFLLIIIVLATWTVLSVLSQPCLVQGHDGHSVLERPYNQTLVIDMWTIMKIKRITNTLKIHYKYSFMLKLIFFNFKHSLHVLSTSDLDVLTLWCIVSQKAFAMAVT